ncbi:hypothetical protein ANCCAN_22414 [Ancylostoma caninum]|uniref:VWFA domain-containing protein n=1 Tax=Ancylostoma caninum TaxID=29170 RepID=A0A368FNN3_ANCCA|nr:hypothetical protein ANCCAN_22414 [Ancylostoma caninum]
MDNKKVVYEQWLQHVHNFLRKRRGGGKADLHKSISDSVKRLSLIQNDGTESIIVFIVTAGKPSRPDKVLEGIEKLKQLRATIVVLGMPPATEVELRQYSTGITEVLTGYPDQNLLMRTMSKVDQLFTRNECVVERPFHEGDEESEDE